MNNYQFLIARLDAFIRKYYVNQLLRGLLVFSAAVLAYYLLASVGEYYFYFPSWLRYCLLTSFIGVGGFAMVTLIVTPLLKIQKLGKVISHETAAAIIGLHFPNVQDKLLNVLQLKQRIDDASSKDLIEASIEQKTKELTPIPFQSAIDLARNRKYLPYLFIPMLLVGGIFFVAPNIFKDSAERLLAPSQKFIPKAPFTFSLLSKDLQVPQFEDFEVKVQLEGKRIPDNILIRYNGQDVMMQKNDDGSFSHTFNKVSKSIAFDFSAAGFNSEGYTLKVLPKPMIKQFKVSVDYPEYTGRKDEILDNIGDIVAPQGTTLSWVFNTENTDEMSFALGNGKANAMGKQGNNFFYAYRFMRDTNYTLLIANKQITHKDSLHYQVSIIPDQFPSINVQQYNDSLTGDYVLFVGEAGDDYGIRSVSLQYTIQHSNEEGKPLGAPRSGSIPVSIKSGNAIEFNQFLDITQLQLQAGDKLSYYFSACDNDAINGSKCTKSVTFAYEKPTLQKLDSIIEKNQQQISKDLNNTSKQNDKMEKDIKDMQEKMLQKNELDWEDKKKMDEMMERNENLQKQIDNIKKKFDLNNKQANEKEYSDKIKDKQENLEKLLDELKNNQLNERMKKLEELMKMLDKDKLFDQLKQAEQDNNLMEKDID
ncbi:MAG: hypothetical protein RIQ62_1628, partial [Bacteroidota bacterium]